VSTGALIALAIVIFGWSLLSEQFAARNLTGPLVFLTAGLLLANASWGIVSVDIQSSTVHVMAEVTLALLLFADASMVPLGRARQELPLTARLLGVGLPLSIVAGTVLAVLLFPTLPVALAGLVAASLAPTDAALSASVIDDDRLPRSVREVLNVESGLNDGIATPVVTYCIAAAAAVLGLTENQFEDGLGAIWQLAIGMAVGAGIALLGGRLIRLGHRRGWMQHGSRRLAALAVALLAFLVASEANGNPFVAAFIGGLVFGATAGAEAVESVELTGLGGDLLSLVLWFVFGAGFILPAFEDLTVRTVLYAIASLTVVRMAPVAIALLGSGQDRATTMFVGWFGPRGLASVVFALLTVEELGAGGDPRVAAAVHAIAITIVFSVVAHGITARPLATRYVAALAGGDRRAAVGGSPDAGDDSGADDRQAGHRRVPLRRRRDARPVPGPQRTAPTEE
jgi:NhaP-type Na+/H+ or K+/H+ antiporter